MWVMFGSRLLRSIWGWQGDLAPGRPVCRWALHSRIRPHGQLSLNLAQDAHSAAQALNVLGCSLVVFQGRHEPFARTGEVFPCLGDTLGKVIVRFGGLGGWG